MFGRDACLPTSLFLSAHVRGKYAFFQLRALFFLNYLNSSFVITAALSEVRILDFPPNSWGMPPAGVRQIIKNVPISQPAPLAIFTPAVNLLAQMTN